MVMHSGESRCLQPFLFFFFNVLKFQTSGFGLNSFDPIPKILCVNLEMYGQNLVQSLLCAPPLLKFLNSHTPWLKIVRRPFTYMKTIILGWKTQTQSFMHYPLHLVPVRDLHFLRRNGAQHQESASSPCCKIEATCGCCMLGVIFAETVLCSLHANLSYTCQLFFWKLTEGFHQY